MIRRLDGIQRYPWGQQLVSRRWHTWAMRVIGALTIVSVPSLNAQVTYNVFPARSDVQRVVDTQPTDHHASPKVTIVAQDSTVESMIVQLAHQANLRPVYNNTNPVLAKRISVRINDVSVMDAFAIVLRGTGLAAAMAPDGETVVIRPGDVRTGHVNVASGIITGRVTDSANGQGLSGASVKVAGTKLSAVTSDSGHFTLRDVPDGDQVLNVRLFGYKPLDRTVTVVDSQRTILRILMVPVPTVLTGVVTTATGTQRKVEVGNDITSLNVDSIMRTAPVNTVTDLLETRVPGLTVTHSSGEPGAPSRLRLRGIGSIAGNNDPIVIVDGIRVYANQSDPRNQNLAPSSNLTGYGSTGATVASGTTQLGSNFAAPSPIDQIDPNNIETIEVFKGPSASALYGSDAANGVIVITTKHGRAGPTQWSLSLRQGINWIPGSWPTNYFRFGTNAANQSPFCNWFDPTCLKIDSVVPFQALNDPRYTVFTHGSDQNAALTVSGGVPVLQYSVTGTATNTVGNLKLAESEQQRYDSIYGPIPGWIVHPDKYPTWGVTGSLTAQPYSTLRVTLNSTLFNSNQQSSSLQGSIAQLEGAYVSANGVAIANNGKSGIYYNSLGGLITDYVQRVTDAEQTTGDNLMIAWTPRPWLPITANGGLQTMERTDVAYIPYGVNKLGTVSCGLFVASSSCSATDTSGYYGLGRGLSHTQNLSIGTSIPAVSQRVTVSVGGEVYNQTTNDFTGYTNALAPGVTVPNTFNTVGCTEGCGNTTLNSTSSATYGWYVEPRLNINSRFFAAPGFRFDGGSGSTHATTDGGAAGGLSAFPKLDLSYIAVDRQTNHPLWGFLTQLRPRVSFGLAGTQPAPEDRLRLFNIGSGSIAINPGGTGQLVQNNTSNSDCPVLTVNNNETIPGVCISSLGNSQLRPERSSELEGGFDAVFWQGRFSMTVTQYNKTRHDAIMSLPVAPSILGGTYNVAENVGEIRNTGTEVTMNASLLQSRALSWTMGINLSNDNNLLVHLNTGQIPNYVLGLVPGYPVAGIWIRPIESFADANHDGVIEQNEIRVGDSLVYVGQPNPKYQLNLNNDLALLNGRLRIDANVSYQNGMTQQNLSAINSGAFYTIGNSAGTSLSYEAAVQAAKCSYTLTGGCYSPYGFIQSVNVLRFNSLSASYDLPRTISSSLRVPRASIALQGSNLGLHTNYRGKDPSVNAFSTVSTVDETADLGEVPQPRTWWLKLTLGN